MNAFSSAGGPAGSGRTGFQDHECAGNAPAHGEQVVAVGGTQALALRDPVDEGLHCQISAIMPPT